jgi:sugar lactone lactonase YvrE
MFADLASVTLTAAASSGNVFTGWTDARCMSFGTNPCVLTLTSDVTVNAAFAQTFQVSVTVAGSGGTVSIGGGTCSQTGGTCSTVVRAGTMLSLTANASGGQAFAGWSGACAASGLNPACTLTVNSDASVVATFTSFTLTVGIQGQGVVGSDAGINCSTVGGATTGQCTAPELSGTMVTLGATPDLGWTFTNWGGACSGAGACVVAMTTPQTVYATFDGPFDFQVSAPNGTLSMIAGESSNVPIGATVTRGSALPVLLSISGLPSGATATFNPSPLTPDGTSTLTVTTTGTVALGSYSLTITGTSGSRVHSVMLPLRVRSANLVESPVGVAFEAGEATALVSEYNGQLSRIDVASRKVLKTITSFLTAPVNDLAIESGGATTLVAYGLGLARVDLATGTITSVSTNVSSPYGVAIESGGATALVTDCGPTSCGGATRLARVTLATGAATDITSSGAGLNGLRSIALEPSSATALIAESGSDRLIRVNLGNGIVSPLATGLGTPFGLALEPSGATAIVCNMGGAVERVTLATGVTTTVGAYPSFGAGFAQYASGCALPVSGSPLLGVEHYPDRIVRLDLRYPVTALAPARQSIEVLHTPAAVALESSGTSALVADCGPTGCGAGRIVRVGLSSGLITALVGGLNTPNGLAIESSGTTALVTEAGADRLVRVDLSAGTITPIATSLGGPQDVVIESSGATALVATLGNVLRVTLATGAKSVVGTFGGPCGFTNYTSGLAIEPSGTTALVLESCPNQLVRLDLGTMAQTVVATGVGAMRGISIEPGGATAVIAHNPNGWEMIRVNLSTGVISVLADDLPGAVGVSRLDGSGNIIAPAGNQLLRVGAGAPVIPTAVAQGLFQPTAAALEPSGTTMLFVDCGPALSNCTASGRLMRVNLTTRVQTTLTSGLNAPSGVAVESGGTSALITDCGPAGTTTCSSTGRLLRSDLAGGLAQVATGLNRPTAIFVEAGGATALVSETGANRLVRVDLASGGFSVIATPVGAGGPGKVIVEPSTGTTALVGVAGGIVRINLATGTSTPVVLATPVLSFALESSGVTALAVNANNDLTGGLYRVNLLTGAVDALATGITYDARDIVLSTNGTNVWWVEGRGALTGGIYAVTVP